MSYNDTNMLVIFEIIVYIIKNTFGCYRSLFSTEK